MRKNRLGRARRSARLRLGRARHFADHLAGLRIVFADGVLPDVDEPFAVHRHAVPLRRIEGTDDVAVLVDVDHRGRPDAAIGERRSQLRLELDIGQIVRTIQHPDVVVLIHGQPRDAAHLPLVRQGFGPVRIELELGRGFLLRGSFLRAQRRPQDQQSEAGQHCESPAPYSSVAVHDRSSTGSCYSKWRTNRRVDWNRETGLHSRLELPLVFQCACATTKKQNDPSGRIL